MDKHRIEPFYSCGQQVIVPDHVEALAQRILDNVGGIRYAKLSYYAERQYIADGAWDEWRLVIFDINTGLGAEIIDYSNAQAVADMHTGDTEAVDAWITGQRTMLWVPLTNDTEALLFPAEPTDDEKGLADAGFEAITEAIDRAEYFADYPVLDEDDLSRREGEAWNEALESEMNYLGVPDDDELRMKVCEKVGEHWGESDSGWVNPDWVRKACAELNIELDD